MPSCISSRSSNLKVKPCTSFIHVPVGAGDGEEGVTRLADASPILHCEPLARMVSISLRSTLTAPIERLLPLSSSFLMSEKRVVAAYQRLSNQFCSWPSWSSWRTYSVWMFGANVTNNQRTRKVRIIFFIKSTCRFYELLLYPLSPFTLSRSLCRLSPKL
jgi:hypothetical protein